MEMFAPGHEAGLVGAEQHAGVGDLRDVPEPADRMPGEQLRLELVAVVHRVHHGAVQLGLDHPRHQRVRADALRAVLDRDVVGQHVQAGLRDVVAAVALPDGDRADGAHVDDRAAARLDQVRDRVLRRRGTARAGSYAMIRSNSSTSHSCSVLPLGRVDAGVVDDGVEAADRLRRPPRRPRAARRPAQRRRRRTANGRSARRGDLVDRVRRVRSGSRPPTATCAPSRANRLATSRPMPLEAPVTSARFACQTSHQASPCNSRGG